MSMVAEAFREILLLEDGQNMLIKVADESRLNSIRTLLYREKQTFERKTGQVVNMACQKIKHTDGSLYLEVRNEAISFQIVEDKAHDRSEQA